MNLDHPLIMPVSIGLAASILVIFIWLHFRSGRLESKNPLFTPEYRAFLGQLDIAVRSHLMLFPMVSVTDVLDGHGSGKTKLKKYKHDQFDFVVCHRRTMELRCIIQLGREGSDKERLRELCRISGMTLLEYDRKPYRNVANLRQEVFSASGIDEFNAPPMLTEQFEKTVNTASDATTENRNHIPTLDQVSA